MGILRRTAISALIYLASILVVSLLNSPSATAQELPPPRVAVVYCVCGASDTTAAQNAPAAASDFAQRLANTFQVKTSVSEAPGPSSEDRIQQIADNEHAAVVIYYQPDWIRQPHEHSDTLSVTVNFFNALGQSILPTKHEQVQTTIKIIDDTFKNTYIALNKPLINDVSLAITCPTSCPETAQIFWSEGLPIFQITAKNRTAFITAKNKLLAIVQNNLSNRRRLQDYRVSVTSMIRSDRINYFDPDAIVTVPDGSAWFTESAGGDLIHVMSDGTRKFYRRPNRFAGYSAIALDHKNNLWFIAVPTNYFAAPRHNEVGSYYGYITPAGRVVTNHLHQGNFDVKSMTMGSDGTVWFSETGRNRIARISSTGSISEFILPDNEGTGMSIILGPDGNVWTTGMSDIFRITPFGRITTVPLKGVGQLRNIADSGGSDMWITDYDHNELIRVSSNGSIKRIPESGPLPLFFAPGPNNKAIGFILGTSDIVEVQHDGSLLTHSYFGDYCFGYGLDKIRYDGNSRYWFSDSAEGKYGFVEMLNPHAQPVRRMDFSDSRAACTRDAGEPYPRRCTERGLRSRSASKRHTASPPHGP